MKLEYIKANGEYYHPQELGQQNVKDKFDNYPVCIIKKLLFGRWQIDYFDTDTQYREKGKCLIGAENTPNRRIILYPSGIEEISYLH